MATVSASVVQYGRRKGSDKNVTSLGTRDGADLPVRLPDLRQVKVLPKAEWLRIQDSLHSVNRELELIQERKKEREALHQRSKEVVKNWSNTIAGQRQKKIEAKKLREEIEEEEKRQIDLEEAQYQAERRKEAIEKAKSQQYYQTDRVKRFHSALLLTEILKEREAQIELKQKKMNATKDMDKDIMAQILHQEEEAIHQDQQKALQRFHDRKATTDKLMEQIKEHERAKELERLTDRKEGEEIQKMTRLYEWEKSILEQQKKEEKRQIMKAHMDHLSDRDILRAIEKQKEEEEEERIKLFSSAKQKMQKMRKEKEAELFRDTQQQKERMVELLAAQLQQKESSEDEVIARAVAEREAKLEKELKEKEEKKKAELGSIAAHRQAMRQQKEDQKKEEKLKALEMLYAKKEADKIFLEKQWGKTQKIKDENKKLQSLYIQQMAEKREKAQLAQKAQLEYEKQTAALTAVEEQQFQEYAKEVTDAAAKAGRNTNPLQKAATAGLGGGLGPVFGGVRPSYLVQDETGVQLPNYNRRTAQEIKEIYDAGDIQLAKKRLGFTW
ncbi:cilia- and flagella- associated protein 210 [Lepisosteus oculatus]|uniref:Cilia and flagella associated protein 210 n=1 Tax=Lepisosteus oculatus TaxID=7918 RepID=W5MMT9_LEPOC|nr:PREDICTED: coiled-coil domain-containing protein 173 [Lepisosteus oculatus]